MEMKSRIKREEYNEGRKRKYKKDPIYRKSNKSTFIHNKLSLHQGQANLYDTCLQQPLALAQQSALLQ